MGHVGVSSRACDRAHLMSYPNGAVLNAKMHNVRAYQSAYRPNMDLIGARNSLNTCQLRVGSSEKHLNA